MKKVGKAAGGIAPETVIADAVFRFAGEPAANAIKEKQKTIS